MLGLGKNYSRGLQRWQPSADVEEMPCTGSRDEGREWVGEEGGERRGGSDADRRIAAASPRAPGVASISPLAKNS